MSGRFNSASKNYAQNDEHNQNLCGPCWKCLLKKTLLLLLGLIQFFWSWEWGKCGFIYRDQSMLGGGCKWTFQRLCTVAFVKIFHLFFFHPHPGLGPVLLGRINLNVITDNGISQAHLWAMLHTVTFPDGRITGHKQLHSHLSINPSGTNFPGQVPCNSRVPPIISMTLANFSKFSQNKSNCHSKSN